jgi:Tfp pilus assembly protein PilO
MTARDRTVLIVLVVAAAIIGAWFAIVEPKRSQAGKLGGEVTAAQAQLAQVQGQVAAGEAAKSAYAGYYNALAKLGEAMPTDDDTPSLLYQLQAAANASHVDFQNFVLTPGGSAPSLPAVTTPTSTGATGATGTTGSSGAAAATQTTLPPGATVGQAGLPIEPYTLTFEGNYFKLADFLGRIERFVTSNDKTILVRGRLLTLNAINVAPAPQGFPEISVTITVTTYLSPSQPTIVAPTAPTGSTAPTTPASNSTSPSFPTAAISIR